MADVPLYVVSDYSSSERRITPAWSITQLKRKLEPITGIPPSCQRISLKTASNEVLPVEAADEENVFLQSFPLTPYAELRVSETGSHFICEGSLYVRRHEFSHELPVYLEITSLNGIYL